MAYINVDEVYILDNTGLQVDMATDIPFADAGFNDTQKAQARKNIAAGGSNRNLLDNPWFTVNQRGAASATNGNYGVDRWKGVSTGYTVNNDGTISVAGAAVQVFGDVGLKSTDTYTLSVKYADGTTESATGIYVNNTSYSFSGGSINIYPSLNQINIGVTSKNVRAVKLELGSVSTLANDPPPDYGTELLKCKYYFRRIQVASAIAIGLAYASSTTRADLYDYPQGLPMRPTSSPTATFNGTLNLYNGSNHAVTAIYAYTNGTQYNLRIDATGLTANQVVGFFAGGAAYIDISHDL